MRSQRNNATRNLSKKRKSSFDFDSLKNKVIHRLESPIDDVADLERFLANWWCRHYSKPFKCREVLEYTLEELIIEYLEVAYHNDPNKLRPKGEPITKEDAEDEDWLKKMMGKHYTTRSEQEKELSKHKNEVPDRAFDPDDEYVDLHKTF